MLCILKAERDEEALKKAHNYGKLETTLGKKEVIKKSAWRLAPRDFLFLINIQ